MLWDMNSQSSSCVILQSNTEENLPDTENDDKWIQNHGSGRLWLQAAIVLAATFSNLSDGMSTGWVSSALAQMLPPNNTHSIEINSKQAALIGTLPMYAIFCSAPFSIYSANRLGRKWTILWGTALTCISWICLIIAEDVFIIYVGAFIRGFGGNVIFTVIPMYSAEISHPSIRGILGSLVAVMMNIGVLLSYVTTLYWPLWVTAVTGAIAASLVWLLFIWAPRSPYHILVSEKNKFKARKALCKVRGEGPHIDKEILKMETAAIAENEDRQNTVPILELITIPANRKVTFLVITLQFIQQLTGVDAILIYLEFILIDKNSSLIFGTGKLISCILSLFLVDRLGRKPLLIFSCLMSCVTLLTLGGYFYARDVIQLDVSTLRNWLPLTTLVVFICCYNIGLGIVPFIYGGELYPTRVKALGVTIGEAMYALPMIIATQIFALTQEVYGVYFPILIFAVFSFLGTLFCIFVVVETKGKTLQDIQTELKRNL